MDLEGHTRERYRNGMSKDKLLKELTELSGNNAKAEAILLEIINTENITNDFIRELSNYTPSGISAGDGGLGCRGAGDFFIHNRISDLINNRSALIDPKHQDDAGVVQVGQNGQEYLSVCIDGMHSRLSHFPFIAGYHAARAAIRDIIVMGCEPKALISDIHLANDGDVAKIFDYTAGIGVVSELTDIPLIAGSTLRIGGDLVLGDRITGGVGCVGMGKQLTPRDRVKPGDVLIMTEGSGGGTIATTALYNGYSQVVTETLNLKFITLGQTLVTSDLLRHVHTMTDVTNGGLRGDAFEIAKHARVRIFIYEDAFRSLINPQVLEMLTKLEIDPLGVSIDSLLLILPKEFVEPMLNLIGSSGQAADVVGRVGSCEGTAKMPGVRLIKDQAEVRSDLLRDIKNNTDIDTDMGVELTPEYREAPYTPIKKVVNIEPKDRRAIEHALEDSMKHSLNKKEQLKSWILAKRRM